MTKREQNIAMIVGAVGGLWLLDSVIITPLLNASVLLRTQVQTEAEELEKERGLIQNKGAYIRRMEDNKAKGLLSDPNAAVAQLANKLNSWAAEQNLTIGTMNPNQVPQAVNRPGGRPGEREPAFMKVSCSFTVTGGMMQMANFISLIQNAEIPIRISELRVNSKEDGGDRLELFLTVSSIILKSDQVRPDVASAAGAGSTSRPAGTSQPSTTRREGGRQ
jgi:hypothetical protein